MINDKLIMRNTEFNNKFYLSEDRFIPSTPFEISPNIVKNENSINQKLQGALEYLLGCLVYTITIMIGKYIHLKYSYIPILTQNFYRSFIIAVISYIVMINQLSYQEILNETINSTYRKEIINRCICGFFNFITLAGSSNYLRMTTSSTITSLSPLITVFFALVFLKEKINNTNIICLIVSLIGCLILAKPFAKHSGTDQDTAIGYIYIAVFLITRSGTVILQKQLSNKISIQTIMFCISFTGSILTLVLLILNGESLILNGLYETFICPSRSFSKYP